MPHTWGTHKSKLWWKHKISHFWTFQWSLKKHQNVHFLHRENTLCRTFECLVAELRIWMRSTKLAFSGPQKPVEVSQDAGAFLFLFLLGTWPGGSAGLAPSTKHTMSYVKLKWRLKRYHQVSWLLDLPYTSWGAPSPLGSVAQIQIVLSRQPYTSNSAHQVTLVSRKTNNGKSQR